VTKEEIAEALGVANMVNAGAALVYFTRTLDAFEAAGDALAGDGRPAPGAVEHYAQKRPI
jgi:alkylhydroperoxidase/carboxymuconolactone decarboxylase family protein YurZ